MSFGIYLISYVGGCYAELLLVCRTAPLPSNEFDANPIADVIMAPIQELEAYGFSAQFADLVREGFPSAGSYQGLKSNIGL